jgi:hypothetical protein
MSAAGLKLPETEFKRAILRGFGGDDALREVDEPRLLEPLPSSVEEFASKCCFTYDQRAAEFNRALVEPFPTMPYLLYFLTCLVREPRFWCEKAVQMMISWAVAVWALHDVLTNRGHEGAWMCLDRLLACKHIEERVWRLYDAIPARYAKPYAKIVGGIFEVYHDGPGTLATSSITPMAQETSEGDKAAKRTVSWAWTWAFVDEGARTRKAEEIIGALQNRCGKIIFPSSVDGPATYHHRIGYAKSLGAEDTYKLVEPELLPGSEGRPMKGVTCWRRFGWFCMAIDYIADPHKDASLAEGQLWWSHPATVAARAQTANWKRDMLRDATIRAGNPVYTDTDRIETGRLMYFPDQRMLRGHDYSFAWSVCVVMQTRWCPGGGGDTTPGSTTAGSTTASGTLALPGIWKLHVLKEIYSEASFIRPHKGKILAACRDAYGDGLTWLDFGDYSANARTETGVVIEEFKPEIQIISRPTGPGGIRRRTEVCQHVISGGLMAIETAQCPMLWQAIQSGYVRGDDGEPIHEPPWADFCNAWEYAVDQLFVLDETRGGGKVARLQERFMGNQMIAARQYSSNAEPINDGVDRGAPVAGVYRRRTFRGNA